MNRREITNNTNLEQPVKLAMMKKNRKLHAELENAFGLKSYQIFSEILTKIVEKVLSQEKAHKQL